MFSTPARALTSGENTRPAWKKPGGISMKPFADRPVNAGTPNLHMKKKAENVIKKASSKPLEDNGDEDLCYYDTCSFKDDNENYLEIKPLLSNTLMTKICFTYSGKGAQTPPVEYTSDLDLFLTMPQKPVNDLFAPVSELYVEDCPFPQISY